MIPARSVRASLLAILLVASTGSGDRGASLAPARYLYVWAGTGNDSTSGLDMMTVLDANPTSPNYGKVLAALTVDSSGRMPHHTEFVLPANGPLFANDFSGDKSFLVDFSTPESPRLAGRLALVPNGRRLHSFARLSNGHVLATVQFGDNSVPGEPGGLAEFDAQGTLVRTGWSRDSTFPGARIRTYALAVIQNVDRVVTTSSPMNSEQTAHVIQVWRLSDLTLLKTLSVPAVPGDSAHMYPFEVRALDDGSVMLNSYYCGFFRISSLAGTPRIDRVMALPLPANTGCSVPVVAGRFMVMPIAYAHRFATIDIADPAHPREVASFPTDSTFFPHWASADPGSDRLVFTDQGDGLPMVKVAHLDRSTGRLSWDRAFADPGAMSPGVSYHREAWPNGVRGMAMPHGAVFVP
ncbi:MAG TPA: hypothetical protein VGP61_13770 [Gemmatimonadales bacterium]|nr:hypothetical protein [Gemmatimonadales bacterium]